MAGSGRKVCRASVEGRKSVGYHWMWATGGSRAVGGCSMLSQVDEGYKMGSIW